MNDRRTELASEYLSDTYVTMLTNHFSGLGDMHCALELKVEHYDEMNQAQKRALDAFLELWSALEVLEREGGLL
jgi:hypothetical protein